MLRTLFLFFIHFLERPWVLFGVIIGLSSGYVIALTAGMVYGCIKCFKFTHLKISQLREQRENTEAESYALESNATKSSAVTTKPSTTTTTISLSIILEKACILHIHIHILHLSPFTAFL